LLIAEKKRGESNRRRKETVSKGERYKGGRRGKARSTEHEGKQILGS
jgi:hypothetical protein